MKRIITYDLKHADRDDYQMLYDLFDELNGIQLTESTYVINTELSQQEIKNKIKKVIYEDDTVYYISVDSKSNTLFYNKI